MERISKVLRNPAPSATHHRRLARIDATTGQPEALSCKLLDKQEATVAGSPQDDESKGMQLVRPLVFARARAGGAVLFVHVHLELAHRLAADWTRDATDRHFLPQQGFTTVAAQGDGPKLR